VGTIIASYLSKQQMKENYGDEWVLANGDEVLTKSAFYKITGKTKLPDLRGMFIRGLNVGRRDDKQDPGKPARTAAGEYQGDAFAKHNHGLVYHGQSFKGAGGDGRPALDEYLWGEGDKPTEGADETRPKNVAVYFYIKIN